MFLSNDVDFADQLNKFNAELDKFRKYEKNLSKFISEITFLRLKNAILPEDGDHSAWKHNDIVKKQIDLLWNLKILDVRDHYILVTPPSKDGSGFIQKVQTLNPMIYYLDSEKHSHQERAQTFFNRTVCV